MERPFLVNTQNMSSVPNKDQIRQLLAVMHKKYSTGTVDDPQWLHSSGTSYGHVRCLRLNVHTQHAQNLTGQESIAYACDVLLNQSLWIDNEEEIDILIEQNEALCSAIGLLANELGHDMTYDQPIKYGREKITACVRHIEEPDGPLVPQAIIDNLWPYISEIAYLSREAGNRKYNLRFGRQMPYAIPRVQQSSIPVLELITDALTPFDPVDRMRLLSVCSQILSNEGR